MRILIVFYSRTGTTKKVAARLAQKLNCEIEEIFDTKKRTGLLGYIMAGRDAWLKEFTQLEEIKFNPADFDLVIVGTPIWAKTVSTPIRSYLWQYGRNTKAVAFFCTGGGSAGETFWEMELLCHIIPKATLQLNTKEVRQNKYEEKLEKFIKEIG